MRNFIILFFVLNLSAFSNGLTQGVAFVKFEDASLYEVFESLKEQTGYGVLYRESEINEDVRVNMTFENSNVYEVLEEALDETGLTFKVQDEVIVIFKETARPETPVAKQEKKSLKGKVTDEEGIPLPGVSVVIKGTNIGVATNIDGEYSLEFEQNNVVLVFSFVGMNPQEFAYEGQKVMNVTLTADSEQMAEVVVTGYQTLSKERATGSFDKIDTEHIGKPASNISERLVGSMAGVNATTRSDGSIGFEIRGKSSLMGDVQPLVVVDGFPVIQEDRYDEWGNLILRVDPFSMINPNDVESITVLKDAAAASIWGAKSANGVIVITTKKGKKGKVNVEFSSFWKFTEKADLNYFLNKASSAETIEYEKAMFDMALATNPWSLPAFAPNYASSAQSQAVTLMNEHRLNRISTEQLNAGLDQLSKLDNRSQIKDKLMNNPFTQQYNLRVSGGSDIMSNNVSMMYEGGNDNFEGNNNERFTANFKNNTKITDWLDFEFGGMIQYLKEDFNGAQPYDPATYSDYSEIKKMQPYEMLINTDGSYANLNNLHYYTPVLNNLIPTEDFPYSDWSFNPIQEIKERDFTRKELNTRIQTGLNFKIIEGLSINSKFMYEQFNRKTKKIYSGNSFAMRKMVNQTSSWITNPGMVVTQNMPKGGGLTESNTMVRNYNFRNQLNFNRVFNDVHAINFIAGTEITDKVIETSDEADIYGYDDERLSVGRMLVPYSPTTPMWLGSPMQYARYGGHPITLDDVRGFRYGTDRYFSIYGNLSYTYNDKYTVSFSARNDASNLITDDPEYRYSPFWSVGGTWQMSKEEFLSDVNWLNRLTLRGTFGYNGNVDPTTSFRPLIGISSSANPYSREVTAGINSYGNPTLRWEKTRTINIGTDFAMFGNKLTGSIDLYHKLGTDLIVNQSIPDIHGTNTARINNGEMVNKGIEIKLGTSLPIVGKDIEWIGNLNFAYNKNEVTKFYKTTYAAYELTGGGSGSYTEGMDANTIWSYKYGGMYNFGSDDMPNVMPAFEGKDGNMYPITIPVPGSDLRDVMFAEGTRVAPYIVGFTNTFKIYDFNLSFVVTGKFGHEFRRTGFDYSPLWGGNTNVNSKYTEVRDGDPNKIIPIPTNERFYYRYSWNKDYLTYLTANAGHIRFQEVNLTYNCPKKLTSKLGLAGLQVYAQANNLGTILFNDYDEDPEYPLGTIKPQKIYTFGLKLNL
jgi:TonB-linked SusC/RagA family outer membrane protein